MLLCQQSLRPERGCGSVEPPRSGAKIREIAIDKAGIELTLAKSRRTTKRSQKAGIATWADHELFGRAHRPDDQAHLRASYRER